MKKSNQKTLNIARKYPLSSITTRWSESTFANENIFNSPLQNSPISNHDKPYQCVGLKQIKEYINYKKNKSTSNSRKRGWHGAFSSCINTYTAVKSTEQQDNLMNKQELINYYHKTCQKQNFLNSPKTQTLSNNCSRIKSPPSDLKQISRMSTMNSKQKLNSEKNRIFRYTENQQRYLCKLEQLKKNTLKEKRQNIPPSFWKKSLRNSSNLIQLFEKLECNMKKSEKKNFKLVAKSKANKQLNWISSLKEQTLFQLVENKRNNKMLENAQLILPNAYSSV